MVVGGERLESVKQLNVDVPVDCRVKTYYKSTLIRPKGAKRVSMKSPVRLVSPEWI